ncbi:MAG: regulatory protein RecX [Flavobacteriales bacterium]
MAITKKKADLKDVLPKIRTYCNYRDRCHKEVRDKLYELGLWRQDVNTAITQMIEENLLNEERYARSYVRGHFYNKHWGKVRIVAELKARQVHSRMITMAMEEIDESDYEATIQKLIEKKSKELTGNQFERKQKMSRYLAQKGYAYADFSQLLSRVK